MSYEFNGMVIPEHMMEAMVDYVERRIPPGGFLQAVICNDLAEAVGRADSTNIRILPAYVGWFYNEAPAPCWHSRENFEAWIAGGTP